MKSISFRQINLWVISCTPFFIWLGQYIKLGPFSLANYFILVLTVLNINFFKQKDNKYIVGYVCFFVLMAFYSTLSVFFTYNEYTLTIIMSLFTGISTMVFVGSLNEKNLKVFLESLRIFMLLMIFWSVFEIFTGKYFLLENIEFTQSLNFLGLHYPATCFSNPNDLSQFFIMTTGIVLFADLLSNKNIFEVALFLLLELFIVINTSSRLSLMCIVLFAFLCTIISLLRTRVFGKLLCFLTLLIFIFIMIWVIFNLSLIQDLINRFLTIDFSQSYVTLRGDIYKALISLGEQYIWSGAGIGRSYIASKMGPHNFFLFIFSDLGIFFSLGFIGVLIALFCSFSRNIRISICQTKLNQILLSLLAIFPFFSSISSANEQRKTIWVMLGICLAVIKNSNIKKLKFGKEERNENLILF